MLEMYTYFIQKKVQAGTIMARNFINVWLTYYYQVTYCNKDLYKNIAANGNVDLFREYIMEANYTISDSGQRLRVKMMTCPK